MESWTAYIPIVAAAASISVTVSATVFGILFRRGMIPWRRFLPPFSRHVTGEFDLGGWDYASEGKLLPDLGVGRYYGGNLKFRRGRFAFSRYLLVEGYLLADINEQLAKSRQTARHRWSMTGCGQVYSETGVIIVYKLIAESADDLDDYGVMVLRIDNRAGMRGIFAATRSLPEGGEGIGFGVAELAAPPPSRRA